MSLTPLFFDLFVLLYTLSLVFVFDYSYFVFVLIAIIFSYYRHKKQLGMIILISIFGFLSFYGINKTNDSFVTGVIKDLNQNKIIVYDQKIGYVLFLKEHNLKIGDKIKVDFKPLEFESERNNGGFNEKNYYYGKHIFKKGQVIKYEKLGHRFSLRECFLDYLSQSKASDSIQYLLAGKKNEEIQNQTATLQSLSVLHLFAVSGMHFSLLRALVSKVKNKYLIQFICLLYALCLEGNIAAWRAYLMMVLKEINYDGWNELDRFGLVGILFIIYNPYIILNMSFVYSMSMYLAVILFKNEKLQWLYVYLVSLMIQASFNYVIWPLGLLFVFIMTPYIELLFLVFIVNCCLGFILDSLCLFLWNVIMNASVFLSSYSFKIITGQIPILLFFLYFYMLVYVCRTKKLKSIISFSLIIMMICLSPYLRNYGEITMIDVGQGDCFLVSLPYQKANFLIDTGGNVKKDIATNNIIPYLQYRGISRLDAVFISHDDYDHCGALESLVEHFNVKKVIKELDVIQLANIEIKNLNHYEARDKNDGSQVLSMKIGPFNCLFLGDASSEIEEKIVQDYPNIQVDLLKVSHHGSYTGTSNKLLEKFRPQYALISCGKNNLYKHPHKIILSRLEAYGLKVYRSDQKGMVNIYFKDDSYCIKE